MKEYNESFIDYLSDESKMIGYCDYIEFPKDELEVIEAINQCKQNNMEITVQGGKTGIVGGSVPKGGALINVSKMDKIISLEDNILTVMPGVPLSAIKTFIDKEKKGYIFPVDSTEKTASIGGVFSTGARGPRNYHYGDCINFIDEIEVIDLNGNKHIISSKSEDINNFYKKEGRTGVVTLLKLKLIEKYKNIWGIFFFFENIEDVVKFTDDVKVNSCENILCFEYLDPNTIKLINSFKNSMGKLKGMPSFETNEHVIYLEIFSDQEDQMDEIAETIMFLAMNNNSDVDKALAVSTEDDLEKMSNFRHAAAECCNMVIEKVKSGDERITKLSTDISGIQNVSEFVDLKTKIDYVIFGHILESHLHINFLPKNFNEYLVVKELIKDISVENYKRGANIFRENGIGKLKWYILDELKKI